MTSLLPRAQQKLALDWPPSQWSDVTALVAVSGGSDSVALLRLLADVRQAGRGRLVVAHFNHQLRGADSDHDEHFVRTLAGQLDIACECGRADVQQLAANDGGGVESAARRPRYAFLECAAARHGARFVATAHTSDDQAETILHRILRGTGLTGLAGMPRVRPLNCASLIRPLLGFRRQELTDYLREIGQPFREDNSNVDVRFTRARIRHELLPHLAEKYNPRVVEALLRLATLAGEAQSAAASATEGLSESCLSAVPGGFSIDCELLAGTPPYLVREVLISGWRSQCWPEQSMGFDQWEQLAAMTDPPLLHLAPKIFPGCVRAARDRHRLVLTRQYGPAQ